MAMITYELAKKLKEAGFPQKGSSYFGVDDSLFKMSSQNIPYGPTMKDGVLTSNQFMPNWDIKDVVYFPNLEELIEACGNILLSITQVEMDSWVATGVDYSIGKVFGGDAHADPTKAVALLWLSLHNR